MKTMMLVAIFGFFAVSMMQANVTTVEIAQMQRDQPTMMADAPSQAQPVQLAAR